MKFLTFLLSTLTLTMLTCAPVFAIDQAKVDAKMAVVAEWGKDPTLVGAVKALNTNPAAELQGMTQDAWSQLLITDPKSIALQKNAIGSFLKSKKEPWVAEAFVSLADGTKAGYLAKPSNWSHKGKPKHDVPMTGKAWQGELETDQSTGKQEIQVSVPVLDGATPIGSLVVGLDPKEL